MLLRAGLVSIALLLTSRLLGLLRESVQAAALGTTGLADVAVLMLTLPDLLTGIFAAGALAYVLLPLWARQPAEHHAQTQRTVGRVLLGTGILAGALLVLGADPVVRALAPGLSGAGRDMAAGALRWSALALPMALLAALWTTRLQHLRDFTGMYGANLVVNAGVIAALLLVAAAWLAWTPVAVLGLGLVLAMWLRLVWLRRRIRGIRPSVKTSVTPAPGAHRASDWPQPDVWLWALASAGLPLALPLLGRSLASSGGEGDLTTFNYAWKLVELPLVLAVQLVATLSFPAIAQAFSPVQAEAVAQQSAPSMVLRRAFTLAWVLACAAAAALSSLSLPLAQLLFGWGRMPPEAVQHIAGWSRVGAWSLLPQALLAVLLTLMASTGRLRGAVLAYSAALVLLGTLGWLASRHGGASGLVVMWGINGALGLAAIALWVRERAFLRGVLQIRDLLPAAMAAGLLTAIAAQFPSPERLPGLGLAVLLALLVLVSAWPFSSALRQALQR